MDETGGLKLPEILDTAEVIYLKEELSENLNTIQVIPNLSIQVQYPFPNRLPKH